MQKTIKTKLMVFIFIALMLLSPICMASDVAPISSKSIENITVDDGINGTYEFIASDVYKFEENVVIGATTIDGNVFAFGNDITITGEVCGDVFAFGGTVTLSETSLVHGNVFVFAKDLIVNGDCSDIYAGASTFVLGKHATVGRDIRVGADKVFINGKIRRDAYINTSELRFPENASKLILGKLEYTSHSEFVIDEGIVEGNIKYIPEVTHESTIAEKIVSYITNILSTLLYSLAIVLLAIWLTPKFKEKAGIILKKKAPLSFGIGILTSIVVILGFFALIILTDGLAFGISAAVLTLYILALTIAKTVFSMACAKLINSKMAKDGNIMFVIMTLLVTLAISIIQIIPYVGGIVGFIVMMIGLGIIVFNLINKKSLEDSTNEVSNNDVNK